VWPCSSVKRPSIGCRSRSTSSWKRRRCRSISAKCGRCRASPRQGGPCTRPLGSVLPASDSEALRRPSSAAGTASDDCG
jgi:hypothetical protein